MAASGSRRRPLIDDGGDRGDRGAGRPRAAPQPHRRRDDPRRPGAPPRRSRTSPPSTRPSMRRCPRRPVRYPVPAIVGTDVGRPPLRLPRPVGRVVRARGRRSSSDRPADELALVVAHLGGGCSVTAVDRGRSVDTSMGMTPLEGLMMGTRAGSIDPGIIFRLLRTGLTAAAIEADLDRRSGLLAVGGTADMAATARARSPAATDAAALADRDVRPADRGRDRRRDDPPGVGRCGRVHRRDRRARTVCDRPHQRAAPSGGEPGAVQGGWRWDRPIRGGPATLRIAAREDLVIADAVVATLGGG